MKRKQELVYFLLLMITIPLATSQLQIPDYFFQSRKIRNVDTFSRKEIIAGFGSSRSHYTELVFIDNFL